MVPRMLNIALMILSIVFFLQCAHAGQTHFWKIKKAGAKSERVKELNGAMTKCEAGLSEYFADKPGKLIVIAYGDRASFVEGLQKELGFSKQGAEYFKENSAPRPFGGKFLTPPDQKLENVCHEVVHQYLENRVDRSKLLNAKWFDEGAASYLAALIFGENFENRKEFLKKTAQGKYILPERMETEKQWGGLHKDMQSRKVAYLQASAMMEFFFKLYSISQFNKILDDMNSVPFDEAFKNTTGVTVKTFYKNWSKNFMGVFKSS